jgi:hypothetical protein
MTTHAGLSAQFALLGVTGRLSACAEKQTNSHRGHMEKRSHVIGLLEIIGF